MIATRRFHTNAGKMVIVLAHFTFNQTIWKFGRRARTRTIRQYELSLPTLNSAPTNNNSKSNFEKVHQGARGYMDLARIFTQKS